MNEFLIELQAKLDEAKSKGNFNADIKKIQDQLDKLKIQAEIDPKAVSNIVRQLETVLNKKINISNININTDTSNAQNTGQKIGKTIIDSVQKTIDKENINTDKLNADIKTLTDRNLEAKQLHSTMTSLNKTGTGFFDNLKSKLGLLGTYFSTAMILSKSLREVKEAINFSVELDSALTNINYTMDVTSSQLEQIGQKSISMAKDLNTSAKNVLGAVKLYANTKETADSILQKAQPAIMLSNVTGFSGEQSAKYLQTIMNQFDLAQDDLMNISDIVQGVSQSIAHDFADGIVQINEGIETSGEVARAAGMDLAQYASMIGLLVEKTGLQGSQLGNAVKTIITRTTKAGKILGIDEGEISDAEKSLKNVGIAVRETDGEFREFQDTMRDLSKVWDNLSDVEKSNIAFNLAGTRQINVIQTLLRNWSDYEDLVVKANESAGVTFENQEKYAESLEGKMEGLSATMTSVWENLINEDSVSPVINVILKLAEGFDKITGKLGLFGAIGTGAGLFAGLKNVGIFRTITDDVTKANKSVKLFGLSLKNAIDTQAVTLYNAEIAKGTNAQEALALASKGTNKATIALMQSANGAAVSTEQLTAAQKASTIAAKAQSAALKAVSIAGNMLIFTAISKTISFVTEKFDEWMHRVERAKEALDESNSTYETAVSDLENLQKELQETADRMAELETGGITLVEQEEYDRLVEANKELERTIALKKIEQQADARQAASDAVDLYNKMFKGTTAPSQENIKSFADDEMFGARLLEFNNKDINDLLSAYLSIQDQIKKTKAEMDTLVDNDDEESQNRLIELQEQLELGEAYLTDYSSLITEYSQTYQDILDGINAKKETELELTASEIETYNNANTALDLIGNTLLSVQERLDALITKNGWEDSLTDLFNSEKSLSEITGVLSAQYPELSAFIDAAGMSVEELAQKFTTLEEAKREAFNNEALDLTASASKIIDQLNTQIKPAFDSLKLAYKDIFSDDGFNLDAVDIPMLESIKSDIEELNNLEDVDISINMDDFNNFAKILTDVNTTEEQAHQAFDDLATSIFNATTATEGMTDETVKLVEQLLESLGVVNATEVAEQALMESKAQTVLATYDLINATESEYVAILAEGEAAGVTRQAIYSLMAAEIAFGQNDLSVEQKIAKLHDLATAYGDTASAALATAIANDLASGHTDVDTAINDLMAKINAGINKVDIDFGNIGGGTSGASKAAKSHADAYLDAFQQEYDHLKDLLNRGEISESQYLNSLRALYIRYFADRKEYLDEFKKYESEYINGMVSLHNKALSGISTLLNKRISAANESKSAVIDALNEEKEAAAEVYQSQIDAIEEQKKAIDNLIKQKQKQIDAINEEIDRIEKAAETRKKNLDLQQQEYNLQKMLNQRTTAVYKEGQGFVWETDTTGIRDAKEKVTEAKEAIQIDNLKNEISLIQKEINLLEEKKNSLSEQQEQLQKLMDESNKYYENLIKEQEKYWDSIIKNFERNKSRWEELAEVEEIAKAFSYIQQVFGDLGYTVEDVLNGSDAAFEDFKSRYISLMSDMNSNTSFAEGLSYASGVAKEDLGSFLDKTQEVSDGLDTLGSKATELDSVADSMDRMGTSATALGESTEGLNTNLEGISDSLTNIPDSEGFSGWITAFESLGEAIKKVSDELGIGEEGTVGGLVGALQSLSTLSIGSAEGEAGGIVSQFNELKTAVDAVTAAISGGGSASFGGDTSTSSSPSMSAGASGEGASGLTGAIEAMKKATDEALGSGGDEGADGEGSGAIGQFEQLKTAVDDVTAAIGSGGESEGGSGSGGEDTDDLIGAINNLGETTEEILAGGGDNGGESGGVIGRFEEFKDVIGEANEHVHSISEGLDDIDGKEVECTIRVNIETTGGLPAGLAHATGTALDTMNLDSAEYNAKYGAAHVEGTALASGNWAVQSDEKDALLGEIGPEIVVRNGRFFTVGDNGAEMFHIRKGDIVFNAKQSAELLKNGHISGRGKAYADGTVGDKFASGVLRPLQPSDRAWEFQQKVNDFLAKHDGDISSILTPVNSIQRDMEQMAKSINTVNNISNSNNRMQQVTNEFHITLPNVTNSTSAEALMKDLQSIATKKFQTF